MDVVPSYFTATLSQSQAYNIRHHNARTSDSPYGVLQHNPHYVSLTDFVEYLARKAPNRLAAGSVLQNGTAETLTFGEANDISARAAMFFRERLGASAHRRDTIALLASSSLTFMITWLALIRSGYCVLLVAPQNTAATVKHLLDISQAMGICYDAEHAMLAESAIGQCELMCLPLEWLNLSALKAAVLEYDLAESDKELNRTRSLETAYYFHSTGTTGRPKLIPQSHHGAVGVLPLLQETWPSKSKIGSTFTTTPLYHGGIADLLRSWSAGAPLWLFSEACMRITGANVLSCIQAIDRFSGNIGTMLENLSCVPFVLEMLVQESTAADRLKKLDWVGVGGAAMPQQLGNKVVAEGIKLVSRFGSSECGFLLSSERDCFSNSEWSILREGGEPQLFELQEDDRYELVVPLSWPAVCTAEHAKRPFRTKDMFERIAAGWRYLGRDDAQLTLATGKKFDPSPIESAIRQSFEIQEAVIVGEGKVQPAVLLFLTQEASRLRFEDQTAITRSAIASTNAESPPHARIKTDMMKILIYTEVSRVSKDVKGGIKRNEFTQEFQTEIDLLYEPPRLAINAGSTPEAIRHAITTIVRGQISDVECNAHPETSFFQYGVDSAGYAFICSQLNRSLPSARSGPSITLGTIFEHDSIITLSAWVEKFLKARAPYNALDSTHKQDLVRQMKSMTEQYRSLLSPETNAPPDPLRSNNESDRRVVLLTGATGFLGANILSQLLGDDTVDRVHLLVRGSSGATQSPLQKDAHVRVQRSLQQRELNGDKLEQSAIAHLVDFEDDKLGLDVETYGRLSHEVTHLVHAAWDVNFNLPLRRFRPQLQALVNLQRLIASSRSGSKRTFVFCSSTAARVAGGLADQADLVPSTGYGQSKLVAERILQEQSAVDVAILRIGQLCGSTTTGVWNAQEAWPLMVDAGFRAVPSTYSQDFSEPPGVVLPDLASIGQPGIDWLPVDLAAKRIIGHAFHQQEDVRQTTVANDISTVSWNRVQELLKRNIAGHYGKRVEVIGPSAWLDALEASSWHPAQSLIPLWRENWRVASEPLTQDGIEAKERRPTPELLGNELLSDEILWRIFSWIIDGNKFCS